MMPMENQEKSMLKMAQFESFISHNKKLIINDKNIDLILLGLDVNSKVSGSIPSKEPNRESTGDTLLHIAYNKLSISAYNVLIRKGANFTATNNSGNTVLHEIFHFMCAYYTLIKWDIKKEEYCSIARRIPFIVSTLSAHVNHKNIENPSDSNGLTHFHVACSTNNAEAVEFFLSNGVPVNQTVVKAFSEQYFEGYSGLHFAAQFGHLETTRVLLKYGADTSLKDAKGRTPLHISVERNIAMVDSASKIYPPEEIAKNELIIILLTNHAVDTKLPLLLVMRAIQNLEHVLSQVRDVNQCISMDSQNWPGYTALHFAAHVNVGTVKLLMQYGGDIEAKDANGVTPFDMCIDRYKTEDILDVICLVPKWKNIVLSDEKTKLIDLLLALKDLDAISNFLQKSTENPKLFVPFDSPLWPGFSILHIAVLLSERDKCATNYKVREKFRCFEPDYAVITEILKQGADVTVKDDRKWTPIHFAFQLGKTQTLSLLLKYHHKTKSVADDKNLSHLHIACAAENQDLVEKLLWNEADVNVAYKGESPVSCVYPGWTPLHIAIHKKNSEITKLLLKFGADVHAIDKHGFTPIHGLRLLPKEFNRILFGVPNLRDVIVEDLGLSYLHVACSTLNVDAAKQLLDLGADVNRFISGKLESPNVFTKKINDGSTPLHCALKNLHGVSKVRLQLVGLLLERGADVLIKDSRGNSPLTTILTSAKDKYLKVLLTALKDKDELRKRVERETGVTMLHVACRKLDLDSIRDALEDGADVNARITEDSTVWPGFTPLHVLILTYDDVDGGEVAEFDDLVRILLKSGADATLMDANRRTPLYMAYDRLYAEFDNSSLTQASLMLRAHKNFEINPASVEGISHFHIACHLLDVDVVEKFLNLGSVDVNSTINVFSNSVNAACTPLLLATRVKSWRQDSDAQALDESFAQLKIVDSLIKRGAKVNVEDLDRNTPAHHAALGSSPMNSLLQQFAKNGDLVNARNLRGETPLELLLKKKGSTLEEIRYFISCGCQLNAFNLVTQEGYIGLASSILTHDDTKCLLFNSLVNYPGAIAKDVTNRTSIHNLVSVYGSKVNETQYAELFDMLMKFGCDIDDQDKYGRTTLHVAAQFRNESAVAALLLVGANVNATDQKGFVPFSYIFSPCFCCNAPANEYHDQFSHPQLFKTFVTHMHKLQLCGLDLDKSNEYLLSETFRRFNPDDLVDDHESFLPQLSGIGAMQIEPYYLTAMDFVSDTAAVIDYPLMSQEKRRAVDEFFLAKKSYFQEEFKEAAGIVHLQYRQAVLRRRIIDEAKDSLSVLMRLRLPDLCSHVILKMLKNVELLNLIRATAKSENVNVGAE